MDHVLVKVTGPCWHLNWIIWKNLLNVEIEMDFKKVVK